jgi:hypothetical protein
LTFNQPKKGANVNERPNPQQPCAPHIHVTDPRFVYVPAAATDVAKTWQRFGWFPPSQHKEAEHVQ